MYVLSSLHRCLIATTLLVVSTTLAHAESCHVIRNTTPSPAEQAFLHSDFDHATSLYQETLQKTPNDVPATIGLVRTLLKQQKVKEADDLVQKALATNPKSVPLLTSLGEVQYREGKPWLTGATVDEAMKLDVCYPQLHLLSARLYQINSYYAQAAQQIKLAHQLGPDDPPIRFRWLQMLPVAQRISELDAYLASPTGDSPDELKRLQRYRDYLKKEAEQPHKACHLVSNTNSTTMPFTSIMRDATHVRAFGLDVRLNNNFARLQIDTGAGGLVISRSLANRAGLTRLTDSEIGGIGDSGEQAGYTAHVDSIKIGTLEFRDCEVEVLDRKDILDADGLIGMDVFSHFLVTLDYPMHQLMLGPLPPRPDDATTAKPTLETSSSPGNDDNNDNDSATSGSAQESTTPRGPHDRYTAPEMKDWTPVYRVGHALLMPVMLNGSDPKLFLLDTGAFTTSVSTEVAREVTKLHNYDTMRVQGLSGNVDKVYSADEINFRFANLSQKVRNVVAFDTPQMSRSVGMDVAGFIGFNTLGQTTMKIDYRDGLVDFIYVANRGYNH